MKESNAACRLPRWAELPDLELYMDQVLLLAERSLGPDAPSDHKGLTASMVNNYVKLGLLPPPVKKKSPVRTVGGLPQILRDPQQVAPFQGLSGRIYRTAPRRLCKGLCARSCSMPTGAGLGGSGSGIESSLSCQCPCPRDTAAGTGAAAAVRRLSRFVWSGRCTAASSGHLSFLFPGG